MTLQQLRKEIAKPEKDIDWKDVFLSCKELYTKSIDNMEKDNVLSARLGYINFVKVGYIYNADRVVGDLKSAYPGCEVYTCNYVTYINDLIKAGGLSTNALSSKYVFIISEKTTIEPQFEKNNLPYIKFSYSYKSHYPKEGYTSTWKTKNETFKWESGELANLNTSYRRDNMLNNILA